MLNHENSTRVFKKIKPNDLIDVDVYAEYDNSASGLQSLQMEQVKESTIIYSLKRYSLVACLVLAILFLSVLVLFMAISKQFQIHIVLSIKMF